MPTWKNILTEASTSATNLTSIGTLTTLSVDNITVNGNTISSTNTNGNILLEANGTGKIEVRGNTNSGAVILNCENNSHGVTLQAPAHSDFSGDYTLTLPINDGDANQFLKTNGSGVLSWDDPAALTVAQGGTGATSFADKAVLITQDSGTDTVSAAAMSSNGQLLIGGTSGPAVATLTAGSNVTITNADGSITIASSGGGGSSGIASLSEDSTPTLGGDLIVGSNDIKSVGDVEIVVDSDNNTTDSSFTVKNGAGTVIFSVNESGVSSGLLTTVTPTISGAGTGYAQGGSVTGISISNHVTGRSYEGKIVNSSGTEQTGNPVTIDSSGNVSFTAPATVATGYELRISATDTGKLKSAEGTATFEVTATRTFSYWRVQCVDSSGNPSANKAAFVELDFFTGSNATGTETPTTDATSNTSISGVTISAGHQYSSGYAPWRAFDGSTHGTQVAGSMWWTLGNSTADDTWIQGRFSSAQTFASLKLTTYDSFNDATHIIVKGSNTGAYSGEEVSFGLSAINETGTAGITIVSF